MRQMWFGPSSVVSPREFKLVLGRHAPQFLGYSQHDSHELCNFVVDGARSHATRPRSSCRPAPPAHSAALARDTPTDAHRRGPQRCTRTSTACARSRTSRTSRTELASRRAGVQWAEGGSVSASRIGERRAGRDDRQAGAAAAPPEGGLARVGPGPGPLQVAGHFLDTS